MVFDEVWFKRNQWWLLPYVSHDRDNLFIGTNKPLVEIAPDHVSWLEEPGLVTTEFHVHHVYGRRLYQRLSPLWNLMHRFDMSIWGRATGLNFGFDTLTAYPDADPETYSVDGYVGYSSDLLTWAQLHDAADGTQAYPSVTTGSAYYLRSHASTTNYWIQMRRGFFLFKTSAIGTGTIADATLSLYGYVKSDGLGMAAALHIGSASPASNTDLVVGDYDQVGSTTFGNIAYASEANARYNDISLNASGIAAIAKTGVSKFSSQCAPDIANTAPTWKGNKVSNVDVYMADDTTENNGKDPKLVVTYTAASTFIPQCIFL